MTNQTPPVSRGLPETPLLDRIQCPADVRRLPLEQLPELARELRDVIFHAVARNGGHLASNLGVVELTIALHYVYDFGPFPVGPDRLLWDVGHQSYPHKLLTGRKSGFERLRKKGSVSGFPDPRESDYDLFAVGHAGTAISTAVGMARADADQGRKNHVVAVVGDASIVNGLAMEGLNGAGTLKRQLLIILNDNGMSISKPQGAFSEYLERVRVSTTYEEFKRFSEKLVHRLPTGLGHAVEHAWDAFCAGLKGAMWHGQIFEALGIKYMGPLDGHDLPGLIAFLSELKHVEKPVLLHVKTRKGHGYEIAAAEPTKFHSPAAFAPVAVTGSGGAPASGAAPAGLVTNGCRVELPKPGRSWTAAFADAIIDLARQDDRVYALTAAMPDGTGLSKFETVHPRRYIDTGICESHLVAMAAGMAKSGLRPFAAIYSTFLQRAFDQVWQEVILNGLPVALCMDRAGFVGDDGAVHHGFCDQAFLRPLPGIVLAAPSDEQELGRALRMQLRLGTASAIRYPRDNVPSVPFEQVIAPELREQASGEWELGRSRVLRAAGPSCDATIIAYGALVQQAMDAAELLARDGIETEVVDARFCKPLDGEMLARVLHSGRAVLTVEDHSVVGGFGAAVAEHAVAHGLPTSRLRALGIPERLVAHATRKEQLAEVGLDAAGIAGAVRAMLEGAAGDTGEPAAGRLAEDLPRPAIKAAATRP
ncbi:MAG: 1-deoxy-D-xylulose-5-phosphate synthase [Tepidisphaerales bacterium]